MPVFIGKISQERVNNDVPIVDTKPVNTEKPFVDVRLFIFIIFNILVVHEKNETSRGSKQNL